MAFAAWPGLHPDSLSEAWDVQEQRAARVASRTVAFHVAAIFLRVVLSGWAFAMEALRAPASFEWAEGDPRRDFFHATLAVLALQASMLATVAAARRAGRRRWEVASAATAAVVVSIAPWVSPWHAAVLAGANPSDAGASWTGLHAEAEGIVVLTSAILALGYAVLVPVHPRLWSIVPLSAFCSYAFLVTVAGTQNPDVTPMRLMLFAIVLVLPAGAVKQRDQLERQLWAAEKELAAQCAELDVLHTLSSRSCELIVRLCGSYQLCQTSVVHSLFFGKPSEGAKFTSFLAPSDRHRFEELICETVMAELPKRMSLTLNLDHGLVKVNLVAMCADGHGARGFVLGLQVLEDAPQPGAASAADSAATCGEGDDPPVTAGIPTVIVHSGPDIGQDPFMLGRRLSDASSLSSFRGSGWLPVLASEHTRSSRPESMDSLALSCFTEDCSEGVGTPKRRSAREWPAATAAAGVQTEAPAETADVAVNTTIVMEELGFRCVTCSKPPKKPRYYDPEACAPVIPGPEAQVLIAKLKRKKSGSDSGKSQDAGPRRVSQSGAAEPGPQARFRGTEFNGSWQAVVPLGLSLHDWVRSLDIADGHVRLGDGSESWLVKHGEGGAVTLCGGEMRWKEDGRLVRLGRSGVGMEYIARTSRQRDTGSTNDSSRGSTWASSSCDARTSTWHSTQEDDEEDFGMEAAGSEL